jgi:hypothetical protein
MLGPAATSQALTPAKPRHQAAAAYPNALTGTEGNGQRQGQARAWPGRSVAATSSRSGGWWLVIVIVLSQAVSPHAS